MTLPLVSSILLGLLFTWCADAQRPCDPGKGKSFQISSDDSDSGGILAVPQNDVLTSSGPVRGKEIVLQKGYPPVQQYLGIPYAKPPVGRLRFRKPQPVTYSITTIDATQQPPGCIQYSQYPFPWYDSGDGKSEDCLYLNIWTVKRRVELTASGRIRGAPVQVRIHDGGFTYGSNRLDIYNGSFIPSFAVSHEKASGDSILGNIVFVTVNFRLGALGFLNAGTKSAPGNVGLHDIVLALKWVQQNIQAFGGDPSDVTLAGAGSGAVTIGLLCVSPLAEGLFNRIIMESASPAYLLAENNTLNIAKSQQLAEAVDCADSVTTIYNNPMKVVRCLKDVDALTLAKTLYSFHPTLFASFFPNYGDDILPRNAREALISGDFKNVDVLIGFNQNEGAVLVTMAYPDVFGFFGEKDPQINKTLGEALLRDRISDFKDLDAVVDYYLGDVEEDDYDEIRRQVHTAVGDYLIVCPIVYFADRYSDAGNQVYFYYLEKRPERSPWAEWMGTVRFDEVDFVFGAISERFNDSIRFKEDTIQSSFMLEDWSLFVYDRLELLDRPRWPLYSRENRSVYDFVNRSFNKPPYFAKDKIIDLPHRENCDFFRKYFGFD